ncbi:MAG TPA: hypothetical protein VI455_05590 [Terriglobia bacterium]
MALIDRDSNPALEAASRANGRRSKGPRTAEGKRRSSRNARKHGCYSEALFQSMQQLDEDPRDFVQLRDGLWESHQPANPAQALLVEDLALLRWRRIRNERGQAGVLGRARERLQLEHSRRLKELNRELTSAPQAEVLRHGFYGLADSPGKYEKIGSLLESLLEQVRNCHFALDADPVLTMLWGQELSLRGMYFTNAFRRLGRLTANQPDGGREEWEETEEEAEPEGSDPPGPGPDAGAESGSQPEDGPSPCSCPPDARHSNEGGEPAPLQAQSELFRYRLKDPALEYERLDLLKDLLDERRVVNDAYQHFLQQYVVITPAQRDACLAPNETEWHALRLQEASLDRQIERKTRLLNGDAAGSAAGGGVGVETGGSAGSAGSQAERTAGERPGEREIEREGASERPRPGIARA